MSNKPNTVVEEQEAWYVETLESEHHWQGWHEVDGYSSLAAAKEHKDVLVKMYYFKPEIRFRIVRKKIIIETEVIED